MTRHALLQKLTSPLDPRSEKWVRRVFGAGQAVLAIAAGTQALNVATFIVRGNAAVARSGGHPPDPHGFGLTAVVVLLLVTVLLAFGSASVWRKWSVPAWMPLCTIAALSAGAWMLLSP